MASISARKLQDSLARAREIGIVEQDVEIEGTKIILRNLRPDQYEAAMAECKETTDLEYLNNFQKSHISRAIAEVNDVNLRKVDFIEVEEQDPKTGKERVVKVETHAYLRQNLIDHWPKEVVFIVYRKFMDAVAEAERKSSEKVTFITPDETAEEKIRRLVIEVKELEGNIPDQVFDNILADSGLMRKLSLEAGRSIEEILSKAKEVADKTTTVGDTQKEPPAPQSEVAPPYVVPTVDVEQRLKERVPMNRQAAPVQVQVEQVPRPPTPVSAPFSAVAPAAASRAAQIAAMEDIDPSLSAIQQAVPGGTLRPSQIPILTGQQSDRIDTAKVVGSVDRPPKPGLNPLFRDHRKT